ncbi:Putative flagellin N-methylase of the FliB superfamily [Desulfamplus magnetovallimortis]|uniref:Putative flagellin N-methylase of the FliB superfamily n=1 Tax=Desulfamplus magnetovallimortis TaxID=1246637 RepID=A0A1W1H4H4_9BACT|nr:YkgJ family cysteine cluster protein [Desulfamplus magnetovallimortis]SLM27383.1 Putative flagellin N-methylase of the FliB superfamily [Desulfamplus magnetovallimortis]
MDSELKTADDIFRCRMCGDCCTGFGGTYVSQEDIDKISQYISCDPLQFTDKFCAKSGSRFVLATSENGQCIFFDPKRLCTIHPVKPYMCRAWPFIETIIKNPENWDIMANSCPGMKKNVHHEILIRIVSQEIKTSDIMASHLSPES